MADDLADLNRSLSTTLGYTRGYVAPFTDDPAYMLILIDILVARGYRVATDTAPISGQVLHAAFVWPPGEGDPVEDEGRTMMEAVAKAACAALATADPGEGPAGER